MRVLRKETAIAATGIAVLTISRLEDRASFLGFIEVHRVRSSRELLEAFRLSRVLTVVSELGGKRCGTALKRPTQSNRAPGLRDERACRCFL